MDGGRGFRWITSLSSAQTIARLWDVGGGNRPGRNGRCSGDLS